MKRHHRPKLGPEQGRAIAERHVAGTALEGDMQFTTFVVRDGKSIWCAGTPTIEMVAMVEIGDDTGEVILFKPHRER